MRLRRARWSILAAFAMSATVVPAFPAAAVTTGDAAACTPGYWKNHTDNWLESPGTLIPTSTRLGDVFTGLDSAFPALADDTFQQALAYKGGGGADGAARILLKHAVGAYLNAAFDDGAGNLAYPLRRSTSTSFQPDFEGIVPEVNSALLSQDRAAMLELKDLFDAIANDLACPLN